MLLPMSARQYHMEKEWGQWADFLWLGSVL